jgi:hypothetical protein
MGCNQTRSRGALGLARLSLLRETLARSLLSATQEGLGDLLRAVHQVLRVPIITTGHNMVLVQFP